jgi:hypothetical protein
MMERCNQQDLIFVMDAGIKLLKLFSRPSDKFIQIIYMWQLSLCRQLSDSHLRGIYLSVLRNDLWCSRERCDG